MNINYNQVALRQLRPTLQDILGRINAAAHDTRHPAAKDLVEEAAQMRPGLEMVGCTAVATLANTLSDAVLGLSNPARRGWEGERLARIAAAAAAMASAMPRLLDDLSEGRPTQPVLLYGTWRDLLEAMRAEVPPPETLFQPDPDFEDEKFVRLDADYLRDIVQAASARLAALTGEVEALSTPEATLSDPDFAAPLASAAEIVDWVYRLRHRRGFQAFWLTARALLAAMQQPSPPAGCTPASLLALLRDAHIEMERLAADARQASPGVLMTWVAPLLPPWPAAWQGVAWLDEFRRRLRLDTFWEALGSLAAPPGAAPADAPSALAALRQAWGQWLEGSGSARSAARALSEWTSAAPSGEAVQSLLRAMSKVASWCLSAPAGTPPDEQAVTEVATAVVLQEDVLAWGLTDAAAARLHAQAARLDALMVPGRPGLASLPVPRWDSARAVRDSHAARAMAAGEVAKDLTALEERLSDIHRGDIAVADIRTELSGLLPSLEVGASVLSMLRLPAASVVAADILTRVDHLAGRAAAPAAADMDALSLEMTALADFLSALAEGAEEPLERLRPALALVPPEMAAVLTSTPPPHPAAPAPLPAPTLPVSGEGSSVRTSGAKSSPVPAQVAAPPAPRPPVQTPATPAPTLPVQDILPPAAAPAPRAVTNQEWVVRLTQPGGVFEDARAGQDEEIVDSFVDEASSVLSEIAATRRDIATSGADPELIETLRRFFHTIKGAARLAGLPAAGEVAWWGERIAARWARGGDFGEPVGQVAGLLADAVRQYRTEGAARIEAADVWPSLARFVFAPADADEPASAPPATPQPAHAVSDSHAVADAVHLDAIQPAGSAPGEAAPEPAPHPSAAPAPSAVVEPKEALMEPASPAAPSPAASAPGPQPGLNAVIMDEEYRAALQEDWRTQDALLAKAAASGDAKALRSAAHTLRSLASLLGWEGWSEECAGVERAILASEPVDVEVWASRWRDAIAEAVDGVVPSTEAARSSAAEHEKGAGASAGALGADAPAAAEDAPPVSAEIQPAEAHQEAPVSGEAVPEGAAGAASPAVTALDATPVNIGSGVAGHGDAAGGSAAAEEPAEAESAALQAPASSPVEEPAPAAETVSAGDGAEAPPPGLLDDFASDTAALDEAVALAPAAPAPDATTPDAATLITDALPEADAITLDDIPLDAASSEAQARGSGQEEGLHAAVDAFHKAQAGLAASAPARAAHCVPEGEEGAEWEEVFAAFDTMLDACLRIGTALERVAARRAAVQPGQGPMDG